MSVCSLSICKLALYELLRQIQKGVAVVAVVPTCLLRNVTLIDDSLSAPCKGGKKLVLLQDVAGVAGCGPAGGFPRLLPSRVP